MVGVAKTHEKMVTASFDLYMAVKMKCNKTQQLLTLEREHLGTGVHASCIMCMDFQK